VYRYLRNGLAQAIRIEVIQENPIPRWTMLKRRTKRLGVVSVLGQAAFVAGAVPILRAMARKRMEAIRMEYGLDDSPIRVPVHRVSSANSKEARGLLQLLAPSVVVVNGTRILSGETLASTPAPFINMHAGITPAYRGVHGGYWALVEGRPDLVGTTVHRVDEGIDTGTILDQVSFSITSKDSFWTYPYLHTAAGLPLLLRAVNGALKGAIPARSPDSAMQSALRYHPTIWGYIATRLRLGVK
jgi:methionyl-tRNA formyltransferase